MLVRNFICNIIAIGMLFSLWSCSSRDSQELTITANPKGGQFTAPLSVKLEASLPNTKIYYTTLEKSDPTQYTEYVEPIPVSSLTHLKFYGIASVLKAAEGVRGAVGKKYEEEIQSETMTEVYEFASLAAPDVTPSVTAQPSPTAAPGEPVVTQGPDTTPPESFFITAPNSSAVINDNTPLMTWGAASGASKYTIKIATNSNCATPVFQSENVTLSQIEVFPFLSDGEYYACVTAFDDAGNESPAINNGLVFTVDTTAPGSFTITAPVGANAATAPTVTWGNANEAAYYAIKIATSSGCTSPVFQSTNVTLTHIDVSPSLTDGAYYICVTAFDSAGNSIDATNNGANFSVDTIAPGAFVITGPSGTVTDNTPTVTWGSASGASAYLVKIATNNTCSSAIFQAANVTLTQVDVSPSLSDGTYYICVTAVDSAGNSISATNTGATFNVDTVPPGVFLITSPSGGTTDNTPTVTWGGSQNATKYTVKIGTNISCSSAVFEATDVQDTQLTISPSVVDGTYYACVRALDSAGNGIDATNNGLIFSIDTTPPPVGTTAMAAFGNANFRIELSFTYPDNVTDISSVQIRRASGDVAPATCTDGTLAGTLSSPAASQTVTFQDEIAGGFGNYSYLFCSVDALGTTSAGPTITSARIRTSSHRAFVTSESFSANLISTYDGITFSSGIEGADYRCQYAADHASSPLGGHWKAVLTNFVSLAADRIVLHGPVSNTHGDLVTKTQNGLWSGSLLSAINRDENGQTLNTTVWTGSVTDGTRSYGHMCDDWMHVTSTASEKTQEDGQYGQSSATDGSWLSANMAYSCQAAATKSLYCIEQDMPKPLVTLSATTGTAATGDVIVTVDFPADTTGFGKVIIRRTYGGYPSSRCDASWAYDDRSVKTYTTFSDDVFTDSSGVARRYYYRACVYNAHDELVASEKVTTAKAKGPFQEIFTTRMTYTGNLGGLAGADAKCQSAADIARLGGSWTAVLSDDNTDANSLQRIVINGPVLNLVNMPVATNAATFWDGNLASTPGTSETVNSAYQFAWTGSLETGAKNSGHNCSNWSSEASSSVDGRYGDAVSYWDNRWLKYTVLGACNVKKSLYCVSPD